MTLLLTILFSGALRADSHAVNEIRSEFSVCSTQLAQGTRDLFLCTLKAAKQMEGLLDRRLSQVERSVDARGAERLASRQSEWESQRDQLCEFVKLLDDGRYDYGQVRRLRCRYHAALKRIQQIEN